MIQALRRKFVIVTMSLMTSVFGILIVVNYFNEKYWNELDMLQMVEVLAYSGIFQTNPLEIEKKFQMDEYNKEDNPVIGFIVDREGNVLRKYILGNVSKSKVPHDVIQTILSQKTKKWRAGSYIYSKKTYGDGTYLIVLVDTMYHDGNVMRMLTNVAFIMIGILILSLLSFYLSRFVTEPAKSAVQREKQFVSDASHEFKTPLGAISINAQALEAENHENLYVQNIVSETERMNRLIERLLILAKLEETNDFVKEIIPLSLVVEEMILTYESVAYEKKMNYQYEIEEQINMSGNADDIRQLVAILIDNAIKNTDKLGIIQVKLYKKQGKPVLEVTNTGSGISPEALPHIFERFYSTDTSRHHNSYGLGLAIAKAITERHCGVIKAKSVPGEYTCFRVEF